MDGISSNGRRESRIDVRCVVSPFYLEQSASGRAMNANNPVSLLRTIVAVLPSPFAFVLQWMFWPYIQPSVWFLFYLAVLLNSWIGGLSGGLAATFTPTTFVSYFFFPPKVLAAWGSLGNFLPVVVFMGMGTLFSLYHECLGRTTRRATKALVTLRFTNEQIESRVLQRAAELAQTNESLHASENRLRTIVKKLSEGLAVFDPNGRLLYLNGAAVAMHGFDGLDDCLRGLPEFTDTFELASPDGMVSPLAAAAGSRPGRSRCAHPAPWGRLGADLYLRRHTGLRRGRAADDGGSRCRKWICEFVSVVRTTQKRIACEQASSARRGQRMK